MSDPIRDLEHFPTEGLAVNPLSPAEVRRRGDRLRRRNHTLAAVAGAAAVLAVVVPTAVVLGDGNGRSQQPPVATEPTTSKSAQAWKTEIPDGFPLDRGLTDFEGGATYPPAKDAQGVVKFTMCTNSQFDDTGWPAAVSDRLATASTDLEGRTDARELVLLPDLEAAQGVMNQLRASFASCAKEETSWAVHEVGRVPAGSEDFLAVTRSAGEGADGDVLHIFRVGNAVMAVDAGDLWASSSFPEGIAEMFRTTDPLSLEMCVFAEVPCDTVPTVDPSASPDPSAPSSTNAPEPSDSDSESPDIVLTDDNLTEAGQLATLDVDGTPARWQQVPAKSVPTLTCQGGWLNDLAPAHKVSREFEATATGVDYPLGLVNEAVLAFDTKAQADAAYDELLGWLRDCPATHAAGKPYVDTKVAPIVVKTSEDLAQPDRAHRTVVSFAAPEVCPEGCDAVWFEAASIVQVGRRIILVNHTELGGPCAPDVDCPDNDDQSVWLGRAATTVQAVVGRAVWDQH